MNQQILSKFQMLIRSRKFWAAVIALLLILIKAIKPDFPFTAEQMIDFIVVIVAYIGGTAIEDAGNAIASK